MGATIKSLVNQNAGAGAGNNWAKAHYIETAYELC